MGFPLSNYLGTVTDDQGQPFQCPKGYCAGSPMASTLSEDRVWVCDECGARTLSWRLSEEHTTEGQT
jgi:hypothetical protein